MSSVLEVKNLVKRYRDITAVDDISFKVEQGVCFGLLGPNGAGKTTTIEMLEGIVDASGGTIIRFGREQMDDSAMYQQLGIQFQHTALQDKLTVVETLDLFADLYPKVMERQRLIDICNLADILHKPHSKLSGGQRQRLLLALALINDPVVIFLDEPTTGLDPNARRQFWALIESVKALNKTIILTTHYMDEAQALCDDIVIMDKGKIIAHDSPDRLLQQHFSGAIIRLPHSNLSAVDEQSFTGVERNGFVDIAAEQVEVEIKRLMDAGISLEGLQVKTPNLDDLFLKLTGSQLAD